MLLRIGWIGGLALLLGACHGAVHRLPEIAPVEVQAAQVELGRMGKYKWQPRLSEWDARLRLRRGWDRVRLAAVDVCRELKPGRCRWWLEFNPSREFNALSFGQGRIEAFLGLADQSESDDEIGLTMAHEMAHDMLDPAATSLHWVRAGWTAGYLAGRATGLLFSVMGYGVDEFTAVGMEVGMRAGRLVLSRVHEREADYFAVLIAYRAGLDLEKARRSRANDARQDGEWHSTILDSHPSGAERVALFDRAVAEVRASGGKLPPYRTEWLGWVIP